MREERGYWRRYMFTKEKSAVEGDSKEIWSRIETEKKVEQKEMRLEVSLVENPLRRKEASYLLRLNGRPSTQTSIRSSSLCTLHRNRGRGREGPNNQVVSIKRAADGRRQRRRIIIYQKRENHRAKNGSLQKSQRTQKKRLL